jgi:hypothetical protein
VFNIGARALTSHSLNVHAGHDDVMSVADCGWGMLFARNAQEAGDLCLISRRAAETCQTPFFSVQDGFPHHSHGRKASASANQSSCAISSGRPSRVLMNLMDPANPLMSGRRAESRLVHEREDRPTLVLRPRRAGADGSAFDEFRRQTGAATTSSGRIVAKTPSTSSSAWEATWRRRRRPSITCAKEGVARLLEHLLLPSVSRRTDRRGAQALHSVLRAGTDGRSPLDDGQSSHARNQGGVLRCVAWPERQRTH